MKPSHPGANEVMVLGLGPYQLTLPTNYGPRIQGIRLNQGPQMFAQLDESVALANRGGTPYHFRGGHRLWAGPEEPAVTYASDNHRCDVTANGDSVSITGPVDSAGLRKEILARSSGAELVVEHSLRNSNNHPVAVAAWAITQLRLGGVAILSLGAPGTGLQADRSLSLWPYTRLDDSRLRWRAYTLTIEGQPGPPFKIGGGSAPGRLGYLLEGHLFVKQFEIAVGGAYQDRGAVGQIYLNESFCELESTGPIVSLDPGESTSHRERWSIESCARVEQALEMMLP